MVGGHEAGTRHPVPAGLPRDMAQHALDEPHDDGANQQAAPVAHGVETHYDRSDDADPITTSSLLNPTKPPQVGKGYSSPLRKRLPTAPSGGGDAELLSTTNGAEDTKGESTDPAPVPQPAMTHRHNGDSEGHPSDLGPGQPHIDHELPVFDAHAHLVDFFQHSEGIGVLLEAMDDAGVSDAAITGRPLKKIWSDSEDSRGARVFDDDEPMYYFSLTDMYTMEAVRQLPPGHRTRFKPLLCGFNPRDRSADQHISSLFEHYPDGWAGIGETILRSQAASRLSPLPEASPQSHAFDTVMSTAAMRKVPVVLQHTVLNGTVKDKGVLDASFLLHEASAALTLLPRGVRDRVKELHDCLATHPTVRVLWRSAGIEGDYTPMVQPYLELIDDILTEFPSKLFISVTASLLACGENVGRLLHQICAKHPAQFVVGTETEGYFTNTYGSEISTIRSWLDGIEDDRTRQKIAFENARAFYSASPVLSGQPLSMRGYTSMLQSHRGASTISEKLTCLAASEADQAEALDYDKPRPEHRSVPGMTNGTLTATAAMGRGIPHVMVDGCVHLVDCLQRTGGIDSMLRAMDGCGMRRAVVASMPFAKQWLCVEEESPSGLYSDHSPCYYFTQSDQLLADAWLSLHDQERLRLAPLMSSFNPTDMNAVEHVERLWGKYPKMWRGVGKVFCRHPALPSLSANEPSTVNHPALKRVFQFCADHNLTCLVHHPAGRKRLPNRENWDFLWEIEQTLHEHPLLRLVWSDGGADLEDLSADHPHMVDMMLGKYPNLYIQLSGRLVKAFMSDESHSESWIGAIEKHPYRFLCESGVAGQFLGIAGSNWLAAHARQFWNLVGRLSPQSAEALLSKTADRLWFDGWKIPSSLDQVTTYSRQPSCLVEETFLPHLGNFRTSQDDES